jgi:hypothetical protein
MNFSLLVTLVFLTLIFIEMSLNKYNVSQKYRLYVFLLTIVLLVSYEVYANPKTIKEFFIEITDLEDIPSLSEKNVTRVYKKGESLKLEDIRNMGISKIKPKEIKIQSQFSFTCPYQMIIITRNDDPENTENTEYFIFSNKLNTDSRIYSIKKSNIDETKYNYIKKTEETSTNNKYGASAIYYRKKKFNLKNDKLTAISCATSNDCKKTLEDKKITLKDDKVINYSLENSFLTCESGTCQLYNEYILLAGGHGDDSTPFSNTVDILHLNLNDWDSIPFKSNEYKTYVSSIRYNNKIYFIGGLLKNLSYSKNIEVFNLDTHQFDETIEMNKGYSNIKLTLYDNVIIIYGGFGESGYQEDIIIFNPTDESFKIVVLPIDLINTENICIAGFENHFVILEGIKNYESIEFNNKLVYYLSNDALFEKTSVNTIQKTINYFTMNSFINPNIITKLQELDNNINNNLVISLSFISDNLDQGWIFGNKDSLFGLCVQSSYLYYKINNKMKRINFTQKKDSYYNLILSNTDCIINYESNKFMDTTDKINNTSSKNINLLNLEIYNDNLSKVELHDLYRKNILSNKKTTENSAFMGQYEPDQTDIVINPVNNFKYKMKNLVYNQKKDTAIFKFYNIDTKENQTLEYINNNKNVNLNKFKEIVTSMESLNPLISFTNYNVGLNFEDNIYFSSLNLESKSLSTNLEKISLESNNDNILEKSEINKTRNIIIGSDNINFYNGSIIGLTIIRNNKTDINYNFANIDALNYNKNETIKIILDDNKKIKAILNNIDIKHTTDTNLSNKKSIVFNGIDSSIVLPNINSNNFDIYFWFKTPIVTNQPLVISPDGKWSIKIIDRMVYYKDQNKTKLLSNNIILPDEIYFVSAKVNSFNKETQILVSKEIKKSVNLVDKNKKKCELGQKLLETTSECVDCDEDEKGIKLNVLEYKTATGKKFDDINDSDDLLLRCESCPEGTYTFGKTGQTICRDYNYFKTKMFTIDNTENKYNTLLNSIDKNTANMESLDNFDKIIQNLKYEFK